ncbi:hypothetical protein ABZ832_12535 [Streptantibioticus parmotrematis]|uniref:hypothetical protein n=1 Tax=Streptantibioticus parmotrematis TaxID=2873249 RepID=UPI0033F86203
MTLVLRTTDLPAERLSSLEGAPVENRPLLQPETEPQVPDGPGAVRCLNHPHELALRGIPLMCPTCRARRDWLLINQGRNVWICCRCTNQWLEPEISRADFDALIHIPDGTMYPSLQECLAALGFDGLLAGTHFEWTDALRATLSAIRKRGSFRDECA